MSGTQAEVDELWEKLSAGGAKSRCGWLQAMLQMDKLDIGRLQQARDRA